MDMVQKMFSHVTQKIFILLLGSCLLAQMGLVGMNDLPLKDRLKLADLNVGEYAYMTPTVCKAFTSLKSHGNCDATKQVVESIKNGESLVASDLLGQALKSACALSSNDSCFLQALQDLENGEAHLADGPIGTPGSALVTRITCSTFAVCPTMQPSFVTDPARNPAVICDLDVARFIACQAFIQNLWVSGCLYFADVAELVFTAAQFGWMADESLTGIIPPSPDQPPYLLVSSYFTFTSDLIYPAQPAASQLIARRVPLFGVPTDGLTPNPAPGFDFIVPANFDNVINTNPIEVDIAFFTYANNNGLAGNVSFDLYYEFKATGVQGFGLTPTGFVSAPVVAVTNASTGGAPLNHYVTTACIPAGIIQPQDLARLVMVRTDAGATFDSPIFISSVTFRYPKKAIALPVTCTP